MSRDIDRLKQAISKHEDELEELQAELRVAEELVKKSQLWQPIFKQAYITISSLGESFTDVNGDGLSSRKRLAFHNAFPLDTRIANVIECMRLSNLVISTSDLSKGIPQRGYILSPTRILALKNTAWIADLNYAVPEAVFTILRHTLKEEIENQLKDHEKILDRERWRLSDSQRVCDEKENKNRRLSTELVAIKSIVNKASLWDRFKYFLTGKLDGVEKSW